MGGELIHGGGEGLIRGSFPAPPIFSGKSPGEEVGEGLIRGVELIRGGGGLYVCVCVWGGYNKRFTVPGLKTTNDVTQKHKGVKITKLRKTIATK